MSAPALILTGLQHAVVDLDPSAQPRKEHALKIAATIPAKITDAMEAEEAADALRVLSPIVREVEALRVSIKAPVLALGRKIDATAKGYVEAIEVEEKRIDRALGDYLLAEKKKAEQAKADAEREARRLAFEADLAASKVDSATNDAEVNAAQQVAAKAEVAAVEARVAAAEIVPEKPADVSVRAPWKHEVTDINALFKARPDLCIIEPNNAAIRAQIKYNQNIPGLRIWQEAKASIR